MAQAVSLKKLRSETPRGEQGGHTTALTLPQSAPGEGEGQGLDPTLWAGLPLTAGLQGWSGVEDRGSGPRRRRTLPGLAPSISHSASELHCLWLIPRHPAAPTHPPLVAGSPAYSSQTLTVLLRK